MRPVYILLILCNVIIIACENNNQISAEITPIKFEIANNGKWSIIYRNDSIGFNPTLPVYTIDLPREIIYLTNYNKEILGLRMRDGSTMYRLKLNTPTLLNDSYYKLTLLDSIIVFETNNKLFFLSKDLKYGMNVIKSIIEISSYETDNILNKNYDIEGDTVNISLEIKGPTIKGKRTIYTDSYKVKFDLKRLAIFGDTPF